MSAAISQCNVAPPLMTELLKPARRVPQGGSYVLRIERKNEVNHFLRSVRIYEDVAGEQHLRPELIGACAEEIRYRRLPEGACGRPCPLHPVARRPMILGVQWAPEHLGSGQLIRQYQKAAVHRRLVFGRI